MYSEQFEEPQYNETLCKKCDRFILTDNFLIHQARCPGPSRIFSRIRNVSEQSEIQQKVPCQFCSYPQSYKELDTHPQVCPNRNVECSKCHETFPKSLMKQHQKVCPNRRNSIRQPNHERPHVNFNYHNHREPVNFLEMYERLGESRPENRREERPRNIDVYQDFTSRIQSFHNLIEMLAQSRLESNKDRMQKNQIEKFPIIKFQPTEEPEMCSICFCEYEEKEDVMLLPCAHKFHPDCVSKWLQMNDECPVCRGSCKNPGKKKPERNRSERNRQRERFRRERGANREVIWRP